MLDKIERGVFVDPSEAVFVTLCEFLDIEPHADLRDEALRRSLQAAMDDPRPSIPIENVMEELKSRSRRPLSEPAVWLRRG